jgi:preprotein translocase subunit Sec63
MSEEFKDHFHREEEENLNYDDSAFYYFFISILTLLVLPLTYNILKTIVFGDTKYNFLQEKGFCECKKCQKMKNERLALLKGKWLNGAFIFKFVVCVSLWVVWYLTCN